MTDFFKLAAGLSVYNDGRYDGYVLGKAEWLLNGDIQTVESSIIREMKDYLLINVNGYGKGHFIHGRLIVTMLKRSLKASDDRIILSDGEKNISMLTGGTVIEDGFEENEKIYHFDQEQVDVYLKTVRDTNPIHYGDQAVIPGLMLLDFILKKEFLADGAKNGTIRFLQPMWVNDPFVVRQDNKELKIVSESGIVNFARMIL